MQQYLISDYYRGEQWFFGNQLKYVQIVVMLNDVVLYCCPVSMVMEVFSQSLLNCIGSISPYYSSIHTKPKRSGV
jgi:hypothetical protein